MVLSRVKGGVVLAAVVAGLALFTAACTAPNQQADASPSAQTSPSIPAASPTPVASPTSVETPTPETSPTPATSPSPAKLVITALPFHTGELGVSYGAVSLGASGGVKPYAWSIASGALPPGLTLSSGGTTTGTPTATGNFSFTVRVDDAAGGAAGVPRTIAVVPHLAVGGPCTKFCTVEEGCITVCGGFGSQSGGLAPYRYKVTAGALPIGMGLKGLALTGAFVRPPVIGDVLPGPYQFTVTVTDALGATGSVHAVYSVFQHITLFDSGSTCTGDFLNGCSVQLFYSGGTPGGTVDVAVSNVNCPDQPNGPCDGLNGDAAPNTLPTGFSAVAAGGTLTVTFPSGIPNGWQGSIDLTVVDQSPCSPGPTLCSSSTVTLPVSVAAG